LSGNATTASALQTARSITLSGDVSGSASFDGSANATITATVADDSHNHIISNVDGLQTALDGKLSTSGKAADSNLLDGIDSASFLRSDASDSSSQRISFQANATSNWDTIATSTGSQGSIEVYNTGSGNDAFMAFHTGGDFACYFGLDADTNDLSVGGWSMGANKYRVWHAGNDGSGSGLDADNLDGYTWTSSGKNLRGTNIYADDWFRNYNSGEGLYNEANVMHWYSDSNTSYRIRSNQSNVRITFATSSNTTRAYLYADTGSSIGFLNSAGQWGLRYLSADGNSPNWYFREEGNETWTGNPGSDIGKIEYHSNRFYIAAGSNSTYVCQFRRSGSDVCRIENNGSIVSSGTVTANSDIKLKTNIKTIDNAIAKVLQLRGVEYDRLDMDNEHQIGVIAQEVEKVIPEVVKDNVEYDPETGEKDVIKSVNYGNMVALLIEAVKEQQNKIDEYGQMIREQQNKIDELEQIIKDK